MALVLGINGVFHDPASALIAGGRVLAAAEEERFSRRKHGKLPVPFSTWEVPALSAQWCLREAGVDACDLDAVAYSYDPALAAVPADDVMAGTWEGMRTLYAERAPNFLASAIEGLDPGRVVFVPHHLAHAASAYHCAPFDSCAVMVPDGRGESGSYLAGRADGGRLEILKTAALPNSLGLLYEELTEHLGFQRSSDEYKVMALASYGRPSFLSELSKAVRFDGEGSFITDTIDWQTLAKRRRVQDPMTEGHADLASSIQIRLQQVLLDLAGWLHEQTGETALALAGGVALNCVANSHLWEHGPFEQVWVQPASGDSGTALGAAAYVAGLMGDSPHPMTTAALGRGFTDDEIEAALLKAAVPFARPPDIAEAAAGLLAANRTVAWFQGRSEYGPRALGQRSLLADPRDPANLERMNDIKGREQFRPIAPMVLLERAPEVFKGPLPSPYMLFVHRVREQWRDRIPAVVHVDGTARIQTVDHRHEPLVARMLAAFERRTGVPVVVNTSLNIAGLPMVDTPRDALEMFGASPVDALAIGPFLLTREPNPARR